jgi:SAM-dependent methyltransferase
MTTKPASTPTEPIAFWDERHAARDPWTSGGDRGLTIGENREFYAIRVAMICRALRKYLSAERGLCILDAGCGKGHLVHDLRSFGHSAVGFDSSNSAVTEANANYGEYFSLNRIDDYHPIATFDAVVAMDVLFHILDEKIWERSLVALSRYASAESLLLITDAFRGESFPLGNYIVHRTMHRYEEVLAKQGFQLAEVIPYDFGANPNSLGVFRRSLK